MDFVKKDYNDFPVEQENNNGDIIRLVPAFKSTVQPVALMRLGLFVPTLKSTDRRGRSQLVSNDVSKELSQLSIAKSEGYENVRITGARLDMDNDFKVWVGIIHAFSHHQKLGDVVSISFPEFVRLCGIPSERSSSKLRSRIDESLNRIATNTISFTSRAGGYYITHLVQAAKFSPKTDLITLQADPGIFELYRFDHKVLLQLKVINALPRKESAQALYTFIESLPPDPAPVSIERFRARLNLKSRTITQNATVRKAMMQLRDIGYLDYTELKRGRDVYFCIHYRRPKLKDSSFVAMLQIQDDTSLT